MYVNVIAKIVLYLLRERTRISSSQMSEKPVKKITVKDIAAEAGVSIGTVDRVLHNRSEVKDETRKKVLAIVKELEYTPNILAKSLAKRKQTNIAIVIPDSSDNNPYWEIPIQGIKLAAEKLQSYNTEVNYAFFDASSEESFKEVLMKVYMLNPDGIVLNPVFKSTTLEFIKNFKKRNIPYVFIDVNLKGVDKLGYFGQDAEQSGMVAARLMSNLPNNSEILILKQTKRKVFSQHIESRISGFQKFLDKEAAAKNFNTLTAEIDLLEIYEPNITMNNLLTQHKNISGIFVPNSRAFKLSDFLLTTLDFRPLIVGYDLVQGNVKLMEEGLISYLISQKPEVQAYNAIFGLFDHLMTRNTLNKTNYSPIDIIIKENLEYYKKTN